jgi:Domain of unknown function (DUF3291)
MARVASALQWRCDFQRQSVGPRELAGHAAQLRFMASQEVDEPYRRYTDLNCRITQWNRRLRVAHRRVRLQSKATDLMEIYELAQLNIALMKAPTDSSVLSDFVANLDRINELAERSPGYIWRLKTEDGNAIALRPFGDEYLVNLSTWKDIDSLYNYVYKSAHAEIMKRRKEWFEHMGEAYTVLWWVPAGHRPTAAEAKSRLHQLRELGPSPNAFTFKKPFGPPDKQRVGLTAGFNGTCKPYQHGN